MMNRHSLRITFLVALPLVLLGAPSIAVAQEPERVVLKDSEEFFPDGLGNRWAYRGKVVKIPLQTVETIAFENVSTVTGTKTVEGVEVTVFRDTNPGNHGPSDSFYRRDAVGIVYYGSHPGTQLERQVIPYQIVRFPITYPSSFQQFDKKDLSFGVDLDRDGVEERSDLAARVSVHGMEAVTVPAGTYEALRVEARMNINIHLSKNGEVASGRDVMTAWFARGVGLIKYFERQELPGIRRGRDRVTEITEELVEVEIKSPAKPASHRWREPAPKGILADHPSDHELDEVLFPSGFRPHP